jgi:hypothetical protein
MSRQRRKPRPNEPKFFPTLSHFLGYCGICSRSFGIGERIYWCPKTETTPTMRVHQHCYLKHTGSYAPSDPSRPTVRVGPPGQRFNTAWACPGFVDRLALSVFLFCHSDDHGLW